MSVNEALDSYLKDRFPLTHREIGAEARRILARLKQEKDWGSVRALRELADHPEMSGELRSAAEGGGSASGMEVARRPSAVADYRSVFSLALRKRQAGFSLEDSLDMAVREIYPQTFRKVKEGAVFYVRFAAYRRGIHELRALRELAEDPSLFRELESSLME